MEVEGLSDPDISVQIKLLGTADCFEVSLPARARVSWLKKDVAQKLFHSLGSSPGPLLTPEDIRLVYEGYVLSDSDVVGIVIKVSVSLR
jgi:hypothetical protein